MSTKSTGLVSAVLSPLWPFVAAAVLISLLEIVFFSGKAEQDTGAEMRYDLMAGRGYRRAILCAFTTCFNDMTIY